MRKMSIEERAVKLAHYIIETEDTVRGAAKKFRGDGKLSLEIHIHKLHLFHKIKTSL